MSTIRVRYGYFPESRPVRVACARGWLNYENSFHTYKVSCHPQTSGNFVSSRLDNGDLDIADLGSTPLAQSLARGVDINVAYITHYTAESEGIYVRPSEPNYVGIQNPLDLANRTVGVPFGSTMHYQVLYFLEIFGLTSEVKLRNLSPNDIIEAWDDNTIDAAACWGTAREYVLRENGNFDPETQPPANTLVSAKVIGDWGRETFGVVAANGQFMRDHSDFLQRFVAIFGLLTDSFIYRQNANDADYVARWTSQLDPSTSFMPSLADSLMEPGEVKGRPSIGFVSYQRRALDLYVQQTTDDQLSCNYLLGGRDCRKPSSQHKSVQSTAQFLMDQKVLHSLGQLEQMGDITECQRNETICGSKIFTGEILLGGLQMFANKSNALSVLDADGRFFPDNEIGRAGQGQISTGDSTCKPNVVLQGNASSYEIFDGANSDIGKSYSDNIYCSWTVKTNKNSEFVELSFTNVNVWSGDVIRVYSDSTGNCTKDGDLLLAQITGLQPNLPPLRAKGCIFVEFETDSNQEQSYGDDDNVGDGFRAQVQITGGCASDDDCSGFPCVNGLCGCDGLHWGADCSLMDHCLGTTLIKLTDDGIQKPLASSHSSGSSPVASFTPYRNDLNCFFEIIVGVSGDDVFIVLEVEYDLERTFDVLELYIGSPSFRQDFSPFAVLTGASNGTEKYYIPTDNLGYATIRLITDSSGRRFGFRGNVKTEYLTRDPQCDTPGVSGLHCEIPHCIENNYLHRNMGHSSGLGINSNWVIGRIVSQVDGMSVRPMPWAPDGGCKWSFAENIAPVNTEAIRLIFNSLLDLEPHFPSFVGDKFMIKFETESIDFFVEECSSDEVCSYDWQTGICDTERGSCDLKRTYDVTVKNTKSFNFGKMEAILITDRSDRGKHYSGIDVDFLFVQSCPSGPDAHCTVVDGAACVDDACVCPFGIPCACSCDPGAIVSELTKFNTDLFFAIVLPLVVVFIFIFWFYRRHRIKQSRSQKAIIAEKEEQLEAFRSSVVGMRTATTHYVPKSLSDPERRSATATIIETAAPLRTNVQWCWRETPGRMSIHQADKIIGSASDCWIRYEDLQNKMIEKAYQSFVSSGNKQEFSNVFLEQEYRVDFSSMIQTKLRTGFEREVQRVELGRQDQSPFEKTGIDFSEVETGHLLPVDISGEPQMVLVKGDVIQISSQRQDGWAFGTKLHHQDGAFGRYLLRVCTKGSGIEEPSIFTDTGWFPLKFTEIPSGEELSFLRTKVGDAGSLEPPSYWDPIVNPSVVQYHHLDYRSRERRAVVGAFMSTLKPPSFKKEVKILGVERIQNLAMWQSYVVKRQTICYRESGPDVSNKVRKKAIERFERYWLWHGTNIEAMGKIMQQGFNRSFCGKNATAFGKGVYFARDASYSVTDQYSVPDINNHKYIIACRVVVGEYCKGVFNSLTPAVRNASTQSLYDTTVDNNSNPSIYVTYHDAQAYPEYLIKFELK